MANSLGGEIDSPSSSRFDMLFDTTPWHNLRCHQVTINVHRGCSRVDADRELELCVNAIEHATPLVRHIYAIFGGN